MSIANDTWNVEVAVRPLSSFPPGPYGQKDDQFKATYTDTLARLKYEAVRIGSRRVVVELDIAERDLKRDGSLRHDARPASSRIVVNIFGSDFGDLRYPCGTYSGWQANLRAVALALEALRAVDRYGVTSTGQQYTGFKQLAGSTAPTMSSETAANLLAQIAAGISSSGVLVSVDHAKAALRAAARVTHPDAPGGSVDKFHAVQTARAVLSSHHGVSL